jgi:hypothetical protein
VIWSLQGNNENRMLLVVKQGSIVVYKMHFESFKTTSDNEFFLVVRQQSYEWSPQIN